MTQKDDGEKNRAKWAKAIHRAVGKDAPESSEYTELRSILKILKHFIGDKLNQSLVPSGGRCNLKKIQLSSEEGCLDFSQTENEYDRFKPSRLYFEHFPDSEVNSFLLLEIGSLLPTDFCNDDKFWYEEVVELPEGSLVDGELWHQESQDNDGSGKNGNLQPGSCLVRRHFKGKVLIFANKSLLNSRIELGLRAHNGMTAREIRNKVEGEINWDAEACN